MGGPIVRLRWEARSFSADAHPAALAEDVLLLLHLHPQLMGGSLVLCVVGPHAEEVVDLHEGLADVGHAVHPTRDGTVEQGLGETVCEGVAVLADDVVGVASELLLDDVKHVEDLAVGVAVLAEEVVSLKLGWLTLGGTSCTPVVSYE